MARYRERYGCYPERILADKIYRNRQTLAFCKEHGIRLSGPALGKPPKNPVLSRQAKKQEYQDNCDRNAVEGIFGTAKTTYGLDRILDHLQETAACVIGVALLLLNLSRSLRSDLALFCLLSVIAILPGLRSRAYLDVSFSRTWFAVSSRMVCRNFILQSSANLVPFSFCAIYCTLSFPTLSTFTGAVQKKHFDYR